MTFPIITATAAACLMLLQTWLALSVSLARRRLKLGIGDGGDAEMARLVRRHGNLAENAALYIVVFALLEMGGGARLLVAALAALFVAGRVLHAVGMTVSSGASQPRAVGALLSYITGFAAGISLLVLALERLL